MSRSFDGTNDALGVDTIRVSAYPVTMVCWYYTANTSQRMNCVSMTNKTTANNASMLQQLKGDVGPNNYGCGLREGGSGTFPAGSTFATNTWVSYVYEATATNLTIWAGTTQRAADTHTITFPALMSTLTVGARNNGGTPDGFMSGRVAEVGIYAGQLSADDRIGLAAGCSPTLIRPDLLVQYWSLRGDSLVDLINGDVLAELSGSGTSLAEHPPQFYPHSPLIIAGPAAAAIPDPDPGTFLKRYEHSPSPNTLLRM